MTTEQWIDNKLTPELAGFVRFVAERNDINPAVWLLNYAVAAIERGARYTDDWRAYQRHLEQQQRETRLAVLREHDVYGDAHSALTNAIEQYGIDSAEAAAADQTLWGLVGKAGTLHRPGCPGGTGPRDWHKGCVCSLAPATRAHFTFQSDRKAARMSAKTVEGTTWLQSQEGNQYERIARQYTPESVRRVVFRRNLSGQAHTSGDIIEVPRPKTKKALYIYLHECAHMMLHHRTVASPGSLTRHREEYEAERWAHEKMREAGLSVPKEMTVRAKQYVRNKIQQAVRAGAKQIDKQAAAWCGWTGKTSATLDGAYDWDY